MRRPRLALTRALAAVLCDLTAAYVRTVLRALRTWAVAVLETS